MPVGKLLIFAGLALMGLGTLLTLRPRVPWLGHLPMDILIQRERFTFFFPIVTCLILSLLLTLLLNLFFRR